MSITAFTTIETGRLRLRHFMDADLAPFMAYRNDPEVARYQSWEGISESEARTFVQEQMKAQPGAPGQWFQIAVELKETGVLVGDCALKIEEHDERQAEIGYTLARAYQGQGIASEAVRCVLEYAFVTLGLHRVIAITDCENAASIALLERLGLRREGHFHQNVWFKGKWGDEYLYAMVQEEWLILRRDSSG
ncbi:N-acetyltransferase [Dictyobacter sp. S3.2.2.5]|uniref:N-acetyltransferase n=1 Tax=Dictyobacter halimunensis TaxID=3026934 RepID=A0ABQ6G860_9CHLR|nr:N-acetyltransferase [Dictyobacter sp. S3.2.2.5]